MLDETSSGSERILNDVSCEEAFCPVGDNTAIESKLDDIDTVPGSDYEKIMDDEIGLESINHESSSASVAGKEGDSTSSVATCQVLSYNSFILHEYMFQVSFS